MAHLDRQARFGEHVAHAAARRGVQHLVVQRVQQAGSGNALGGAVHRQQRHGLANAAADHAGGGSPQHGYVRFSPPGLHRDGGEGRVCKRHESRDRVVEPVANAAHHHHGRRPVPQRGAQRQFGVGEVLVGGEALDRHTVPRSIEQAVERHRVHVPHEEIHLHPERGRMVVTRVRGHHPAVLRQMREHARVWWMTSDEDHGCGHQFLRWHYPDQVLGSVAGGHPLSPAFLRAPRWLCSLTLPGRERCGSRWRLRRR